MGVAGSGVMVTVVVAAALAQPLTVAVTLYVPAELADVEAMIGFCRLEVNPEGPVQA